MRERMKERLYLSFSLISSEILSSGISSGNLILWDNGSEASVDSKISAGILFAITPRGQIRIVKRAPRSAHQVYIYKTLSKLFFPSVVSATTRVSFASRGSICNRRIKSFIYKCTRRYTKEDATSIQSSKSKLYRILGLAGGTYNAAFYMPKQYAQFKKKNGFQKYKQFFSKKRSPHASRQEASV